MQFDDRNEKEYKYNLQNKVNIARGTTDPEIDSVT